MDEIRFIKPGRVYGPYQVIINGWDMTAACAEDFVLYPSEPPQGLPEWPSGEHRDLRKASCFVVLLN